jgi:hypothetical protein
MCAPIIESPRTRSAKVRAFLGIPSESKSTRTHPSLCSDSIDGIPAGIVPKTGTSANPRGILSGKTKPRARRSPERRIAPFRSSAAKCFAAAFGLAKPKCPWISRSEGGTPAFRRNPSKNRITASCLEVNFPVMVSI